MDLVETIEKFGRALTIEEVAGLVNISTKTLYRQIKAKKCPAYRIGSQIRLDPKRTADWLRAREHSSCALQNLKRT